jgi:hypothetical protein
MNEKEYYQYFNQWIIRRIVGLKLKSFFRMFQKLMNQFSKVSEIWTEDKQNLEIFHRLYTEFEMSSRIDWIKSEVETSAQ